MMRHLSLLFIPLLLVACQPGKTGMSSDTGDTLAMRYARNLTIVDYDNHSEVTLRNPWDSTKTLATYCLYERGSERPSSSSVAVAVPVSSAAVFSTMHCALLHELQADQTITGICDPEYNHLPYINKGIADGRIHNLGNSMDPNLEQVMNLMPEVLMPSPFENSGGLGRIEALGIPIIWCADYMEVSPLARAEWIRFYGRLFGKGELADSIFGEVEHRYTELRDKAATASHRPRLLPEMPWNGQWTLPASGSTSAQLYADAGADYIFSDLEGAGSIPLSTEHVVEKGMTADVWLIKHHGALSRAQIVTDTPLLATIKAPVWWCNTSSSPLYEETPFHPELLLECLMAILHPELDIRPERQYFQPLQ